eukprot:Rhum_TRINITY_DN14432_c19_g1::Rhum_TRINITY_DN14432_c19_g1_i1::g.91058::m.91058
MGNTCSNTADECPRLPPSTGARASTRRKHRLHSTASTDTVGAATTTATTTAASVSVSGVRHHATLAPTATSLSASRLSASHLSAAPSSDDEGTLGNSIDSEAAAAATAAYAAASGPRCGVPARIGRYSVTGYLGQGSWAVVHSCVDTSSGRSYAVKSFDKRKFGPRELRYSAWREARVLRRLAAAAPRGHAGVMGLVETLDSTRWFHVVVELGGPTLEDTLRSAAGGALDEERCRSYARAMLEAVAFLHAHDACHRDIKPSNILVDADGALKLADFGLAEHGGDVQCLTETCGTPDFTAPEVFQRGPYDGRTADLWSCGVTLYRCLTGRAPWVAHSDAVRMQEIRRGEFRQATNKKMLAKLSPEANSLLDGLLTRCPEERLTAAQALKHPFFCGGRVDVPEDAAPAVLPQRRLSSAVSGAVLL